MNGNRVDIRRGVESEQDRYLRQNRAPPPDLGSGTGAVLDVKPVERRDDAIGQVFGSA